MIHTRQAIISMHEFPWRVTSQIMTVTMDPREGTRLCIALPYFLHSCEWLASTFQKLMLFCFLRQAFYVTLPVTSRHSTGLILHMPLWLHNERTSLTGNLAILTITAQSPGIFSPFITMSSWSQRLVPGAVGYRRSVSFNTCSIELITQRP